MGLFTTEAEEKIRKHWLFSTLCFLILYPLFLCAFLAILSLRVPLTEEAIYEPLRYALSGALSMLIIWQCAYRKYGTRVLRFWLFITPIRMIGTIMRLSHYFSRPKVA